MLTSFIKKVKKKFLIQRIYWFLFSCYRRVNFWFRNKKVYIGRNVQLIGVANIEIGCNSSIGDASVITLNHRVRSDEMKLGEKSHIGKNNFITVGNYLNIGDYFFSSCYCAIIGASHEKDPLNAYVANKVVNLGDGITIGANVFMGAHSKIVGGVSIGFGTIIGGGALVKSDIPPLSLVIGNPARVVSRFDFERKDWIDPSDIKDDSQPTESEYLEMVRDERIDVRVPYHSASQKFGWI